MCCKTNGLRSRPIRPTKKPEKIAPKKENKHIRPPKQTYLHSFNCRSSFAIVLSL